MLTVFRRSFAAAEGASVLPALFDGGAGHGVEEGDDQAYAGEEVEDGEELAGRCGGGEVAVADGGEGDRAEVEGVEQTSTFDPPVEKRPRGEGDDDQHEEPAELGVAQGAAHAAGQPQRNEDQHENQQQHSRHRPDHAKLLYANP